MKKNPNDKVGTYRLRAYPAAQPRDMMHENLPYRINQLNMRGLGTVIRRLISATILIAFIILSFSVIIFATSMKTLIKENPAALTEYIPEWLNSAAGGDVAGLVDQFFPQLASVVVVVVNKAIEILVGVLGTFERHPTISGMHRNKAMTIFLAQAFNTGVLPLVCSMRLPASARSCSCSAPIIGLFCCLAGPKGALDIPFLAGDHYTMDARWHKDVGTILAYSLVIQAIVGCFVPFAPGVVHMLKKKMKMGGVMHR